MNIAEFSATALTRSSDPTSSATKVCLAGMSSAFTTPMYVADTATCQYWMARVQTRIPRLSAGSISASWVPMTSVRLGNRSVRAPARTARNSTGANWSALMIPSLSGEAVSSSTSQDWPTVCIHVPMSETSWPAQKSRKSR